MSIGSCDCCDASRVPVHSFTYNGCDVTACYICQGDVADPYGEHVEIECPHCGGEGQIEFVTGYDPRDGGPTGYSETCGCCEGRRSIWIEAEPITCDDLEFAA